jgi:hypothetical protein
MFFLSYFGLIVGVFGRVRANWYRTDMRLGTTDQEYSACVLLSLCPNFAAQLIIFDA